MSRHRAKYREARQTNSNYSCTAFNLFDTYGVENCKIELVEMYPCESKEELRKREGFWIKQETCVNKRIAGRTKAEYYLENKDSIQEQRKVYRQLNQEQIRAQKKEYKSANSQKIRESSKQYWLDNIDRIKDRRKVYYRENLEKINAKNKEKVECQYCKKLLCRYCMSRHIKKMHDTDTNK
jgi:hypothetical protein